MNKGAIKSRLEQKIIELQERLEIEERQQRARDRLLDYCKKRELKRGDLVAVMVLLPKTTITRKDRLKALAESKAEAKAKPKKKNNGTGHRVAA